MVKPIYIIHPKVYLVWLSGNPTAIHLLEQNINNVDPVGLLNSLRLNVGELDLLDASPPCQGFSIAGKRNIGDERNLLIFQVKRFIQDIQPKSFVIDCMRYMSLSKSDCEKSWFIK